MNSNTFDRLSFLSLVLVIVLLPIFFLPFTDIPVETSKGLVLILGLALSVVFWSIGRFFDGKISAPKSPLLVAAGGIVLVFFLSAVLAKQINVSLFGVMFDLGSFWFIFAGFMLLLMSAILFRTERQVRLLIFGIGLVALLLLVFQSVRLFMPELLSLGVLGVDKTTNIFGTWNAFGLFAGFAALLFLLVVEFFPIAAIGKLLLQIFIFLAVLLLAAVNFPLAWLLLGILSLIIFVYKASLSLYQNGGVVEKRHFPISSFAVVVVSLLFLTSGQLLGNFLPDFLGVASTEVGPSLRATLEVGRGVVAENPFFGTGPNRFGEAWARYKPAAINNTLFWDVPFNSGSGTLPTLVATTGILGILSWLLFLFLFLGNGVQSVFLRLRDGINREIMVVFVLALYLFAALLFYSAGSVIFLLALALTGVLAGLTAAKKEQEQEIAWSFLNDHRKSFFSILTLLLLVIFSVALTFQYVERFASVLYFRQALKTTEIAQAEASINRALAMNYNDLYLRTYSQVYLAKLNSMLGSGDALSETEKTEVEKVFGQAVRSAQLAADYNPVNYQNFRQLGAVYETAGTLGDQNAYSQALLAYQSASELNPLNPALKLGSARSALAMGNQEDALALAEAALSLAPNDQNVVAAVNAIKNRLPEPTPAGAN